MNARELLQAGNLTEAVRALSVEVREAPTDRKRRTFLFELLCFAGEYDRAEKQLDILAQGGPMTELGVLLYRAALSAERTRQELFRKREYPKRDAGAAEPPTVNGRLNGKRFDSLADADPRVGARLEVFAAGSYLWIPFAHLASVEIAPPRRLRDLLWIPAMVRAGPAFKGRELGEVLLPVLAPGSAQHPDDAVRLGRSTVWEEDEGDQLVPVGQKILLVDGEEFPYLEVRTLQFDTSAPPS